MRQLRALRDRLPDPDQVGYAGNGRRGGAESLHDERLPENLYVADSTLFPESAGLPPILTIMALAMKVAEKADEALLG